MRRVSPSTKTSTSRATREPRATTTLIGTPSPLGLVSCGSMAVHSSGVTRVGLRGSVLIILPPNATTYVGGGGRTGWLTAASRSRFRRSRLVLAVCHAATGASTT